MNRSIALMLASTGMAILVSNTNIVAARAQVAVNPNPVRGYYAQPSGGFASIPITTEITDIQRISLPKGRYIVNASVNMASNTLVPVTVFCIFMIDGFNVSEPANGTFAGTGVTQQGSDQFISIPLTVGIRILEPKVLSVACQTTDPVAVSSQASPITAIRVDSLRVTIGTGIE